MKTKKRHYFYSAVCIILLSPIILIAMIYFLIFPKQRQKIMKDVHDYEKRVKSWKEQKKEFERRFNKIPDFSDENFKSESEIAIRYRLEKDLKSRYLN